MTKSRLRYIVSIIILAALSAALYWFMATQSNNEQAEYSHLTTSGSYSLSDAESAEGTTARIYNLIYNNAQQRILTFEEVSGDVLGPGWRAEQAVQITIPGDFDLSRINLAENKLVVYDQDGNRIIVADLSEQNVKQIDIPETHPSISSIGISDNKLVILIDEFLESRDTFIQREVDLDSLKYSDRALVVDLGNKIDPNSLNSSSQSVLSDQAEITRRALDVYEQKTGLENPVVLDAVNGDYVVSNQQENLAVITFGGEYVQAIDDEDFYYFIIQ